MKQKLKMISLFFTISMMLALAACGSKNVAGNVTESGNPVDSEAPVSSEDTYEAGITNGGVYTNDFIGIGCELDENWTYFNQDQKAQINGIVKDAVKDENVKELIDSGKSIYDMYAAHTDGLASINVGICNLGVDYGINMDENEYVDQSLDSTKNMMESAGFTNLTAQRTTVEFAGADRVAIAITGEYTEKAMYEKVICIKRGTYMIFITLCSYNEDNTDNMASLFYSLA